MIKKDYYCIVLIVIYMRNIIVIFIYHIVSHLREKERKKLNNLRLRRRKI